MFGDGVYEAILVRRRRLIAAEQHWARLRHNLDTLNLKPQFDPGQLTDGLLSYLPEQADGVLYLQITRGAAERTHTYPEPSAPTVYAHIKSIRFGHGRPVRLWPVADQRGPLSHVKSLNLLPNVMAAQAAAKAGFDEALLHREDVITEGAHTSVFAVTDGALQTHPLTAYLLPGVTRAVVLDLARDAGIAVRLAPIARDLKDVDEMFVVGTTTGIAPVAAVAQRTFPTDGSITKRLIQCFDAYLARECTGESDVQ